MMRPVASSALAAALEQAVQLARVVDLREGVADVRHGRRGRAPRSRSRSRSSSASMPESPAAASPGRQLRRRRRPGDRAPPAKARGRRMRPRRSRPLRLSAPAAAAFGTGSRRSSTISVTPRGAADPVELLLPHRRDGDLAGNRFLAAGGVDGVGGSGQQGRAVGEDHVRGREALARLHVVARLRVGLGERGERLDGRLEAALGLGGRGGHAQIR